MRVIVDKSSIEKIDRRGGAVYVWPCRLCCAGGHVLQASLTAPARELARIADEPVAIFAPPGMRRPRELHLEVDRRGRVRAYWDGLAWVV